MVILRSHVFYRKGQVRLLSNENVKKDLNAGESFGEIALLEEEKDLILLFQ